MAPPQEDSVLGVGVRDEEGLDYPASDEQIDRDFDSMPTFDNRPHITPSIQPKPSETKRTISFRPAEIGYRHGPSHHDLDAHGDMRSVVPVSLHLTTEPNDLPPPTVTLTYNGRCQRIVSATGLHAEIFEDRSPLLAAAFESSSAGLRLHLDTLSVETAVPFLRYLYTGSYAASGDWEDVPTSVLLHCQMYWLGHLYDLPELKSQGYVNFLRQFEFACSSPLKPIDLCKAVNFAYKKLSGHDNISEAIVHYCVTCCLNHRLHKDDGFKYLASNMRAFHQDLVKVCRDRGYKDECSSVIIQLPYKQSSPDTYASRKGPPATGFGDISQRCLSTGRTDDDSSPKKKQRLSFREESSSPMAIVRVPGCCPQYEAMAAQRTASPEETDEVALPIRQRNADSRMPATASLEMDREIRRKAALPDGHAPVTASSSKNASFRSNTAMPSARRGAVSHGSAGTATRDLGLLDENARATARFEQETSPGRNVASPEFQSDSEKIQQSIDRILEKAGEKGQDGENADSCRYTFTSRDSDREPWGGFHSLACVRNGGLGCICNRAPTRLPAHHPMFSRQMGHELYQALETRMNAHSSMLDNRRIWERVTPHQTEGVAPVARDGQMMFGVIAFGDQSDRLTVPHPRLDASLSPDMIYAQQVDTFEHSARHIQSGSHTDEAQHSQQGPSNFKRKIKDVQAQPEKQMNPIVANAVSSATVSESCTETNYALQDYHRQLLLLKQHNLQRQPRPAQELAAISTRTEISTPALEQHAPQRRRSPLEFYIPTETVTPASNVQAATSKADSKGKAAIVNTTPATKKPDDLQEFDFDSFLRPMPLTARLKSPFGPVEPVEREPSNCTNCTFGGALQRDEDRVRNRVHGEENQGRIGNESVDADDIKPSLPPMSWEKCEEHQWQPVPNVHYKPSPPPTNWEERKEHQSQPFLGVPPNVRLDRNNDILTQEPQSDAPANSPEEENYHLHLPPAPQNLLTSEQLHDPFAFYCTPSSITNGYFERGQNERSAPPDFERTNTRLRPTISPRIRQIFPNAPSDSEPNMCGSESDSDESWVDVLTAAEPNSGEVTSVETESTGDAVEAPECPPTDSARRSSDSDWELC
jgi:hypothetical protein